MRTRVCTVVGLALAVAIGLSSVAYADDPPDLPGPMVELNITRPGVVWQCEYSHGPQCGTYSAPDGAVLDVWYREQNATSCTDFLGDAETGHQPSQHFTLTVGSSIAWTADCENANGVNAKTVTIVRTNPPPTYQCSDGLDNDGDNYIDYQTEMGVPSGYFGPDPNCVSRFDNDEFPWNQPPVQGPPTNTQPPGISGIPESGQRLSGIPGQWANATYFTYQWQTCPTSPSCVNLTGETESSYLLDSADLSLSLRIIETAHNAYGSAWASSSLTAPVEGGKFNSMPRWLPPRMIDGTMSSGDAHFSRGLRFLCQNWGNSGFGTNDARNGCYDVTGKFKPCCGNDLLWGTRADMKAPSWPWTSAEDHNGIMRVGAEGGELLYNGNIFGWLLQGGFLKTDPDLVPGFSGPPACYSYSGRKRFAEKLTSIFDPLEPDPDERLTGEYKCTVDEGYVQPNEHLLVSVLKLNDGQWWVFFNGVPRYSNTSASQKASQAYVGGEWGTDRESLVHGCMGAQYGKDGGMPWQRSTAPGNFTPFTVQTSHVQRDSNGVGGPAGKKWTVGDIPNGFEIKGKFCPGA